MESLIISHPAPTSFLPQKEQDPVMSHKCRPCTISLCYLSSLMSPLSRCSLSPGYTDLVVSIQRLSPTSGPCLAVLYPDCSHHPTHPPHSLLAFSLASFSTTSSIITLSKIETYYPCCSNSLSSFYFVHSASLPEIILFIYFVLFTIVSLELSLEEHLTNRLLISVC